VNRAKSEAIDLAVRMAKTNRKAYVVRNVGGFGQPKYIVISQDAKDQPGSLLMTATWTESQQ
jgi:hypothetical protein